MVNVKGHSRTLKSGKKVIVKPHSRDIGSKRMRLEEARLRRYFPEARVVTATTQYYVSGIPMKSQIITTDNSYTIETKGGTLYSALPPNYTLKGRVASVKDSFYQNDPHAKEITMERFSKSPKGWNLRKKYLLWYSRGRIIQ